MSTAKQKLRTAGKRRRRQYAALPVRFNSDGKLQVLLLTSRQTRRWVIPKGWPMSKLSPAAAAATEAFEEAGLEGTVASEAPFGHYHYDKGMDDGSTVKVTVEVFLLTVSRQMETWPEHAERETRWFGPEEAAELVQEPELAALLLEVRTRLCPT